MSSLEKEFVAPLLEAGRRAQLGRLVEKHIYSDPFSMASALRGLAASAAAAGVAAGADDLRLATAASVLGDLAEQAWLFRLSGDRIFVSAPDPWASAGGTQTEAKAQIRQGLLRASNQQVASPAVQEFIRSMERSRVHDGKIVSIASVIDDGVDLARRLEQLRDRDLEERITALERLIKPQIQICEAGVKCPHTGIDLQDIWRYARHTWSLEYNPLPGRTLRLLIRNSARPNSPVMGIAMLASPAANLYTRDKWIGWRLEDVISRVLDGSWDAKQVAKTLLAALVEGVSDIRSDDLISLAELERADEACIFKLKQIASRAAADRLSDLKGHATTEHTAGLVDIRSYGRRSTVDNDAWRALSETSLFRKKRAEQLVPLLENLRFFRAKGFDEHPAAALYEVLATPAGRKAVSFVLTQIRKRRLSAEVADLAVCGAIQPYNQLLGGKLVALLAASEDARQLYADRYAGQASEISSQIAGRAVTRPSDLKVVTTTSLYGVGSSQYNRLRLNSNLDAKLNQTVEFEKLGHSEGFSVTHLSRATVQYMRRLGVAVYGARRINSVFGEGSSPRTRQIREGLNLIGINDDHLLKHPVGRGVYACELYPGAREDLVGFSKGPKRRKGAPAAAISRAWIRRWLVARVVQPAIIERLAASGPEAVSLEFKDRAAHGAVEATRDEREAQLALGIVQA